MPDVKEQVNRVGLAFAERGLKFEHVDSYENPLIKLPFGGGDFSYSHLEINLVFDLDGASIVDSTEFRSPEKAAKLSQGNKISYTFTSSKAVETSITAMMTSKNTSSNLASALKVTLDGTERSIKDTSFATNQLGFGTNDEYWEPAKLIDGVSLSAASHTIEVENLISSDIKITDMVLTLGGDTEIALA